MPMSPRLLRPRARGGFDPRAISGLDAWWDASDASTVTLNGGSVSSIADKSGSGRTASQAIAAFQPTYQSAIQNGLNVIRFDGSNDILQTSAFNLPSAATAVMVCKANNWTTPGAYRHFLTHGYSPASPDSSTTTGISFLAQAGSNLAAWLTGDLTAFGNGYGTSQSPRAFGPTTSGSNFRVVSSTLSSAVATIHVNNTLISTRLTNVGNAIDSTKNYAMGIGCTINAVEAWNGEAGEIIVYRKQLTSAERVAVERYLARKWGITLA